MQTEMGAAAQADTSRISLRALIATTERRRRRTRLRFAMALAGLMLIAVTVAVLLQPQPLPLAARFRAQTLSRGEIVRVVSATGRMQASRTVQVGTEVSGRLARVEVDYNDRVRTGQVLARFDLTALTNQLAQAAATMEAARAALAQARVELTRARRDEQRGDTLFATHSISESVRDERRAIAGVMEQRVRLAEAELRARSAAHDLARTNLAHATVVSPIDGVIITRHVDPGQTVASVLQTPVLFTVAADLREMRVLAAVDEADIGEVGPDQQATFTVHAYPTRTFHAVVREVRNAPQSEQDVVTYGVELSVENRDLALKPGMTASVRIVTDEAHGVLRAPTSALSFTPPGRVPEEGAVWLLEGERLRAVRVTAGTTDGELTEITTQEDLEGKRVVTDLSAEGRKAYALAR